MVYYNIYATAKLSGLSINSIESEVGLSIGSVCRWNKISSKARSLKKVVKLLCVTVDKLQEETQK